MYLYDEFYVSNKFASKMLNKIYIFPKGNDVYQPDNETLENTYTVVQT